jgi:ATP-dependent Clp protease adapter protein ClpS
MANAYGAGLVTQARPSFVGVEAKKMDNWLATTPIKPAPTILRRPSMWTVIFFDDPETSAKFLTEVLMQIFNLHKPEADLTVKKIRSDGKTSVGRYQKDIAHLKADQTLTLARKARYPLRVVPQEIV